MRRRRVPLADALDLAAEATEDRALSARVREMAGSARAGEGLSDTLKSGGILEPSLLWLVSAAEGTEGIGEALEDVARLYEQRLDRGLERFAVLVRPAAELLIGVVVFAFAYSFLVPLLRSANAVFGGNLMAP